MRLSRRPILTAALIGSLCFTLLFLSRFALTTEPTPNAVVAPAELTPNAVAAATAPRAAAASESYSLAREPAAAAPEAPKVPTAPAAHASAAAVSSRLRAPEALYAVNDPEGVISPVARLVARAVELERRELEVDADGRPGRLRLMRADDFKYPLLRVEERFGRFANGEINPFPEVRVAVADHVMVQVATTDAPTTGAADGIATAAQIEALAHELGGRVREGMLRPGLVLLELPAAGLDALPDAIARLGERAEVRFAEPDWVVGHLGGVTPDDPDYGRLWGLPAIQANLAWEITTGRRAVVVGVIDSGVDYTHPDLADNIFYNTGEQVNRSDSDGNGFIDDIRGWDFYDNTNDPMDENRHGTHVAGTIAAVGNNAIGITGVAWETRIMPLRFLGADGSGTTSGGINAVAYATMMGVDMTNNSWGGGGFSQALYDVIAEARDAGILFVAASGNSGGSEPIFPARYGNPGLQDGLPALDNVISVAASANDAGDSLASFSNLKAHLAAPGVGIYSTVPGNNYGSLNGTSMASPHVAGAAALLLAVQPDMHYRDIKTLLLDSVDDRSADPKYEFSIHSRGRLNINTALRNLNIPIMIHTATTATDLGGPRAGNGVINPGETVELLLSLRSVGRIDTENVSATLSTNSSHITITQATQSYGDFERYQTRGNPAPFVFTVDAATPTPYVVPFALTITADGGHQWIEEIPLTVYTSVDAAGVVRQLDGSPFAGANVTYVGPFSGSVTTATDGSYGFEMVDGTYKVFADADGHRRSPTRLHTAPPGADNLDFVLGNSLVSASVEAIAASARPGGRVTVSFDLSNAGNLPLSWQLRETEYGFEFHENGLSDPARPDLHWKEIRAEHGGSGSRINWWQLYSPSPVSTVGNQQIGWSGMERWSHGPLSFDFEFPFYGQRFSSVRVNNAGWLGFTSVNRSVFYNALRPMPDPDFMDYKIAFQWAIRDNGSSDLNGPVHQSPNQNFWHSATSTQWDPFRDSQHAYAHNWDSHTWVFTWNQWVSPFVRTPPELDTGQIELRSDGSIILRYLDYQHLPSADGFTFGGPFFFSAGLQDGSGKRGLNPIFRAYTDAAPTPGSVLILRPEVAAAWILPAQTAGRLASLDGRTTLSVTLDAGQLPPGVYESSLVVDSNDTAGNAALRIPITFTVSDSAPSLVVTAPASDLTVAPGDNLPVAVVFAGDGTPEGPVELLNGDEVIATLSPDGSGYSYLWESLPGGFHELSARVGVMETGHTITAPVRRIQAGKGLRLRLESDDVPMYSDALISNPAELLQPPVISRNRVSAERFDITPVELSAEQFTWWGNPNNRDPRGRDGSFNIGNQGRELRMVTNNLRKHPFAYTVTADTVIEFEFRAFNDPTDLSTFVYGIGMAEGNTVTAGRVFRLLGERNWGINAHHGVYPYSHSFHSGQRPWQRYRIPVGQFYTGNMQHLVFVAESIDPNYNMYFRDVDVAFRNIRVYEATESAEFTYVWSFNDTARSDSGSLVHRSYFSPGTKEIAVTVTDGPYSATASRVLELPGRESFRVAVNFQPVSAIAPLGFVPDTGLPFGDRGNDLAYGWDSNRSAQTRDDNWLVSFGNEQGVTRIRVGNGAVWRMAVPNGMYTVTAYTGASSETSSALLRFNGELLLDRNVGIHDMAVGSLTLPVSAGEIVISSHRNTASLLYLEINRVDDLRRPPVASFTLQPQSGIAPLPVQFNAADSFDSDGSIVNYAWDFGDGFSGTGIAPAHSFANPGIYNVTLTVTDDDGLIGSQTLSVLVNGDAQPAIAVVPPPLPAPVAPVFGEPQPQPRRELPESGGTLSYTIALTTAPAANVQVSIGTGPRVVATPAILIFTPANWQQPQAVSIAAVDNEWVDGDETVAITATASSADPAYHGLTGAPFAVVVLDNDAYGTVQFAAAAITIDEDHGVLEISVTRTGGQSGELRADFTTVAGSASAGSDFVATSGTLIWAHNDTTAKTIAVTILDDTEPEPPETFQVVLTAATNPGGGSVLGSPSVFTVTILDDDNVNPAIVLQSPADGASFEAGDPVALSADVTSNTANITEVRFFVNGTLVGTRTAPVSGDRYSFDWVASIGATNWHVQALDDNGGQSVSASRALSVSPVPNSGPGGFLRELFRDITGSNVADLTGAPAYPDSPDSFTFIDSGSLQYAESVANYGTRLRAYFVAPKTGDYRFYLAARQRGELWLSTDDQPANRVRILNPNREDNPNSWGNADQRSAAIALLAGQRYYLEALHKAATSGTRHIQVGVELPGGQFERPIPVAFLEPFNGVSIETSTELVHVPEGGTAAFHLRLRQQPVAAIGVQASLVDPIHGGESIEILGNGQLLFTPENWNEWQSLSLYAATDDDAIDGEVTVRLRLDNGTTRDITAREIDAELNHAPTVAIRQPTVAAVNLPSRVGLYLAANASDLDNDPLTVTWQRVSGPGEVTFDDATELDTGARFAADGDYLLRVTVDDGEFSASADVTVRVNPSPISEVNITTTRGGSLTRDGSTWTITGAGAGLGFEGDHTTSKQDSIRFVYAELTGDFDVSGRMSAFSGRNWSYTGLHARNSLAVGSRHFTAGAEWENGGRWAYVRRRIADDVNNSGGENLSGTQSHGWVRITRTGDTFRAFHSTNGSTWTERIAATIVMDPTIHVGIMLDNENNSTSLATATWADVNIPASVNFAPLVDAGPDASIDIADSLTLAASFSADYLPNGPLLSQWQKVSGPGDVIANPVPPTDPNATVRFDLPGSYVLRLYVSNREAITFDDVTITVTGTAPSAPTIVTPPVAQSVPLGSSASFAVTATGHPQPQYQWFFDGSPIPDAADPVLHVPVVTFDNEGRYHVRIHNDLGSAESEPVWLEATAPAGVAGYTAWAFQLPVGQRTRAYLRDGVPNLLRYALGGNSDSPKSLFQLHLESDDNALQLRFTRIADPAIAYQIWRSSDLSNWGSQPFWSSSGSDNTAGDVRITIPSHDPNAPADFFRLRIE